ncbi:DUF1326 domain-containing protein [Pseudoruegeria sp. HB172150]|uniref:DUF1326 domain-containing protein n=1 Tax=Pseudoruegeria sp. HB172150 TaxID=2721164 RepID=UPI00155530E8|nr:DUF1326 domain-containing protein [Pseudoruegeria sp. HB172150]
MTDWEIHGREMVNCNCSYGCGCQFNALPTHGHCRAAVIFEINKGHYGGVKLDGLYTASNYTWDGPVHEGGGTMQLFIDDKATDAQAQAMEKIMLGEDTDDMATMWWVFAAMSPNRLETIRAPIGFDLDIEARTGKGTVGDIFEMTAEPIRNPVTGAEHRARIDLPNGFEYRIAEIGSASTRSSGEIDLSGLDSSYGQFAELHLSGKGVLEAA